MTEYLCVSATLAGERYHGEEWPPAPARLLKAILAGCFAGGNRLGWDAAAEQGFRWLEQQQPPRIIAALPAELSSYRLAVPNNDLDVAAREWSKGRPYDASKLKTMKIVRPRELPSQGPHVHYLWPIAGREHVAPIKRMVHCLHTLGWGIDMAYADVRVLDEQGVCRLPGERYSPTGRPGELRQVPIPGFLDDLKASYERFIRRVDSRVVDPDVRPTVYGMQAYEWENVRTPDYLAFELRDRETGTLWRARSWRKSMVVAAWLRHAAGHALREEQFPENFVQSFVEGHTTEGESKSNRLSYLAIPSIHPTQESAEGVRRAMIVAPPGATRRVLEILRLKLDELWEEHTARASVPVCRVLAVTPSRMAVWPFYLEPRKVWRTVTPLVLHGHNVVRGTLSLAKTERLLLQAFAESGVPAKLIESVRFQAAPFWPGTGAAQAIRVPSHLTKWPRIHVEIEFGEPVRGPLLAGIGRHCGVGLFASAEGPRR